MSLPYVSKPAHPHVKKPLNSFFLYRKAVREQIIEEHGVKKSHEISKIAGEMWAKEPESVKQLYQIKAQEQFEKHKQDNPDYKWPSRNHPGEKKKMRMIRKQLAALAAGQYVAGPLPARPLSENGTRATSLPPGSDAGSEKSQTWDRSDTESNSLTHSPPSASTPAEWNLMHDSDPYFGHRWSLPTLPSASIPTATAFSVMRSQPIPIQNSVDWLHNMPDMPGALPHYSYPAYDEYSVLQPHPLSLFPPGETYHVSPTTSQCYDPSEQTPRPNSMGPFQ
ncbi:hypothetical protein HDU91_000877 [Kappamyces sp. JEL0680]|nr:hypothetical protein HDU91_000877 [Kappamyces sp. JEL0680]